MDLKSVIRNPTIALTVLAPVATYYGLHAAGAADLVALSVSAVFPLAAVGLTAARTHRVDAFGLVSIIAIVCGVATAVFVRDPRLVLVTNSLPTLVVGLVFLASLLGGRSMIEQLAGQVARPATDDPALRRRFRQLTTVWGLALVTTGILHATLAWVVATSLAPVLSLVATVLVLGPVGLWTARLRARARRAAAVPAPADHRAADHRTDLGDPPAPQR